MQTTKAVLFCAGGEGDDVADLHFAVCDHDRIDQQLDESALLLEGGRLQAGLHAFAKRLGRGGKAGQFQPTLGLGLQLPQLPVQCRPALLQIGAAPTVLLKPEYTGEIGLGQALELLVQTRHSAAKTLPSRLKLLR